MTTAAPTTTTPPLEPPARERDARIDADDYRTAVLAVALAARLVSQHDLPRMRRAIEHARALGPVLDPSAYRAKGQAMEEDDSMLAAAMPLWQLGQMLRGRHKGDGT